MAVILMVCFFSVSEVSSGGRAGDMFGNRGQIKGKIVDGETGEPVSGAVVSACWYTGRFRLTIEPEERFHSCFETLTDSNGDFVIPKKRGGILKKIIGPRVAVFKTGYSILHLLDMGVFLKRDHILRENVQWEGNKAIIRWRKKTAEQRKRYLQTNPIAPVSLKGYPGMDFPEMPLFSKELNREYESLGLTPPSKGGSRMIKVVEGGVYPAGEVAVPKK
jgi:hypothetical protein